MQCIPDVVYLRYANHNELRDPIYMEPSSHCVSSKPSSHRVSSEPEQLELLLRQARMNYSSLAMSPEATEMPVGNVICLHLNDPNVCNRPAVAGSIYVIEQVKTDFKIMLTAHF